MKKFTISTSIADQWNRLPLMVRAIAGGFFVSSVGVFTWGALFNGLLSAWAIVPMVFALWVYWKFYSGSWGSGRSAQTRKTFFRATSLPANAWKWGIAAAVFFVVTVQASFVVTFRLIQFPAAKFTADYKVMDSFPIWAAWLILIMSSVVAAICEESGFRGYMQKPLEKRYGTTAGIIITSVCFTAIHLTHTWAAPILPHIFSASVLLGILAVRSGSLIPGIIGHAILDVFDYSVWWTGLTGGFTHQPIFNTGVDVHFITWVLIFILGVFGFFRAIGKSGVSRKAPEAIPGSIELQPAG